MRVGEAIHVHVVALYIVLQCIPYYMYIYIHVYYLYVYMYMYMYSCRYIMYVEQDQSQPFGLI